MCVNRRVDLLKRRHSFRRYLDQFYEERSQAEARVQALATLNYRQVRFEFEILKL